ncbi:diphthine synthase [Candidatus Woesearchaeota archaeon]|nr:MAG: diphthine synthase [Candidatus Woesearchaeota archaeon]
MLYLIGLGLNDWKDITLRGYEAMMKCEYVYLDFYTAVLQNNLREIEDAFKKSIIPADRDLVEKRADEILKNAKLKNVAFLVVGDVFSATTHIDLFLRAKEKNIPVEVVHNASIITAIGDTGLQVYNFGKTASIPFPHENFYPETAYDVLKMNKSMGLHTLMLLDLNPKQGSFMDMREALEILLNIEHKRKENVVSPETMALGCARLGGNKKIKYAKIVDLLIEDFGEPMHCLIFPGNLHFLEEEMLKQWE